MIPLIPVFDKSWFLCIYVFTPWLHFLTLFSQQMMRGWIYRRAWVCCNHVTLFFQCFFLGFAFWFWLKRVETKFLVFGHLMRLKKSRQCFPSCSSLRRVKFLAFISSSVSLEDDFAGKFPLSCYVHFKPVKKKFGMIWLL